MKRISNKLFPAVFLIGMIAVTGIGVVCPRQVTAAVSTGIGTETVGDTGVTITTTSFPVGAVNAVYSQTVLAAGGAKTYYWSKLYGSLPVGLTITDTGLICGTPTIIGISSFTVQVTDSQNPAVSDTKTLSITINPSAPTIITESFPDGAVREAYHHRVRVDGGFAPYNWSISAGSLPSGLSLNASKGVITGIPNNAGVSKFTVRVTDSQNPAAAVTKVCSINISQIDRTHP